VNVLLIRFPSLMTSLVSARESREQFVRLQREKPISIEVSTRRKHPNADLHAGYVPRCVKSSGIVGALLTMGFVGLPDLSVSKVEPKKEQIVIQVDDIPETRQFQRPPPPPRPAVPIETEDFDVPEDITIESTDLDFDDVNLVLLPPLVQMATEAPVEDEPIEFWAVEDKPEITKRVLPTYPEVARRSGIEGTTLVRVLISAEGKVLKAEVLRGKTIFHRSALKAVRQYEFAPARQNDKPVPVWMALPIRFRLVS
jgi:protein TonB